MATFQNISDVYYGTSDSGFPKINEYFRKINVTRKNNFNLVSVIGGLFVLNNITLLKPKSITLFDINPYQITYFNIIRTAIISSQSSVNFLERLRSKNYPIKEEQEVIAQNISLKASGKTNRRSGFVGRSRSSYHVSWRYALSHFYDLKLIMQNTPIQLLNFDIRSVKFKNYVRKQKNMLLFTSNIGEFIACNCLEFLYPENIILVCHATIFRPVFLDLHGKTSPVTVCYKRGFFWTNNRRDKILFI